MAIIGSVLAAMTWVVCAVPFQAIFFKQMSVAEIMVMSTVVITQLCTVTAKACCQGSNDITGANLVIVAEELWFVFTFPLVLVGFGTRGVDSVVLALILSGLLAMATGLVRLARRGFFRDFGAPSFSLAKRIAAFGGRGQLGNMLWLTNLRFDFVLLGALAGPAVLGIYAVASKFAEFMRLAPTAINYVLYPRLAKLGPDQATVEGRHLLPRAAALTLVMTPFAALFALVGPVLLYGSAFHGAVVPAQVIIIGLSVEGAAAVASAYLLGIGRPGLNSVGMGVGAVVTVTLDVLLIPRYGALGGAITSAVAYLVTTFTLTYIAHRVARTQLPPGVKSPPLEASEKPTTLRLDTTLRRAVDAVTALVALILTSPLLLMAAILVKATSRGPALYKQIRIGKSGNPFVMLKLRSMVCDAENVGPLVTERTDPRITRVGAFLRLSKLDELPQLVNVLKGDMTLVGPRPEVPHFVRWYDAAERGVLRARPGLTGLGQIYYPELPSSDGVAATNPEERYVRLQLHPKLNVDLDYLHRRSLRLDVTILLRTFALISHRSGPTPRRTHVDRTVFEVREMAADGHS